MPPLYYPRRNTLLDVAKFGVQLYGLKKGIELQKGQQDVARETLKIKQRESEALYGKDMLPGDQPGATGRVPGLKERELGLGTAAQQLAEQKHGLERKKFEAEQAAIGASKKPVTEGQFAALEASLPMADRDLGFTFSKSATSYMNTMKNLTKQGMVRRDLYEYSRDNWDTIKTPFIEAAQKEMETAAKNNDTEKVGALTKSIDAISDVSFLDQFYPNSARAKQVEEATAQVEVLKATKEPKLYETAQGLLPASQAIGKLKAGAEKPDVKASRLFNDVARNLYKISDMSSIDEQTASRILETTVQTERYMKVDGMSRARAMQKAYKNLEETESLFETIPGANTGKWNNKPETVEAIRPIMAKGLPFSQILKTLIEKGWNEQEAKELMQSAVQR